MNDGAQTAGGLPARPRRDPFVAPRLLFELSCVAAAGILIFGQPVEPAAVVRVAALVLILWGSLLLAGRRWPGLAASRAIRAADLVLFNLCLLAVLTEGALRWVAHEVPSPLFARAGERAAEVIEKRLASHAPGQLRYGFPLNLRGHYDVEPGTMNAERRVAVIGDSFSFGVVPHHFHYTTVAERASGLDVDNVGYPDVGPHEYLWLLRYQVLATKPDAVVVSLFVGNDVTGVKPLDARPSVLESWLDRDRCLLCLLPRRLLRLWRQRAAAGGDRPIGAPAGETSERRLETPQEMTEAYPWLADATLEQPTFIIPEVFLEIERQRALRVADPEADVSALFEILREIRRAAGDVPLAVMLIPDEFQVDDELWSRILTQEGTAGLDRGRAQRVIIEQLASEGIPYLDLLRELRAGCAPHHRGDRHCYHLRDTHWNARGNRLAGEALARFLGQPWASG